MSRASHKSTKDIRSEEDLSNWLKDGSTPKDQLLVGSEHEKIVFNAKTLKSAPFRGKQGLENLFKKIQEKGWQGIKESGNLIELVREGAVISLEPAGQVELATPAYQNVHQIAREVDTHIKELLDAADDLGLDAMGLGYHPIQNHTNLPRVPKGRYKNFQDFMKEKDPKTRKSMKMLYGTSSTQANLGYTSEEDMVKKLRVSLALQPIVTAIFANSPFANGKPNGIQSNRSEVSYNAAEGRYGFMLPVAFEKGFGFERFTEFALNEMPLIGIYQQDVFQRVDGESFADFMHGNLSSYPGQKATLDDWCNHLNCIWPEVRVRQFLEMRGADNGPTEMIKALPALWVGLLYDEEALDQAYEMIKDWTAEDREYLRAAAPVNGLKTKFMGTTVQDIAKNVVNFAEYGLKRRNVRNDNGDTEAVYLEPLQEIVETGLNWAEILVNKYENEWGCDVRKVFTEMSYKRDPSVLSKKMHVPSAKQMRDLKIKK